MKKKPCILLSICLSLCFNAVAQSDLSVEIHHRVQTLLKAFVTEEARNYYADEYSEQHINVETSRIDPRIAIPNCEEPFALDIEPGAMAQSHFSVRISCDSEEWFIYSTAKVNFTQDVIVANGNLSANTILTSQHLRIEQVDASQVRQTGFRNIKDVVGAKMKRVTRDGQPISRSMLCYVCQGDRITIAAKLGGMKVKTTGIAQEDGTLGETIRVLNARSKKAVYAEVASTQEVVVSL